MRRRIVLHHHIFKNAGTTLDWALKRNFGEGYVALESQDASPTRIGAARLYEFLIENPHVVGVTSHAFGGQDYATAIGRPEEFAFLDFMVLRHPLDRLMSMYDFYRSGGGGDPNEIERARDCTTDAWLRAAIERSPHLTNDVQVNVLARNGRYLAPPHGADLERACSRLVGLPFVATVDRFDDACIAAEHFLRPTFGSLDLAYVSQNVTRERTGGDTRTRVERLPQLVGASLFAMLRRLNALDMELVSYANGEIDRRIALVPEIDERRRDFAARKASLRATHGVA